MYSNFASRATRVVLLVSFLYTLKTSATPTHLVEQNPASSLARRQEDTSDVGLNDCVDSEVDNVTTGMLYCVASDGTDLGCEACLGLDGGPPATTGDSGTECWLTDGSPDSLGQRALCPGDPAPAQNPDGTSTGATLIADYCKVGVGGNVFWQFATRALCIGFSTAQEQDIISENMSGLNMLCDTFFAGACTAFEAFNSGALDPIDCVDDPGSDLCSFAGPGKRDVRQMKG